MMTQIISYFINNSHNRLFLLLKLLVLVGLVNILFYFYSSSKINLTTKSDDQSEYDYLFENKSLKYVQMLTGRFGLIQFNNWAVDAFKHCKEKRCFAIKPFLAQYPLKKSDAIVVHGRNLYYMKKNYKRNKKQIWMYYSMESPRGTFCSMHYKPTELDDWFNLTATYKQDSDFVTDYKPGFKKWSDIKHNPNYINEYKKYKKNLTESIINKSTIKPFEQASVFWIVSHCETSSRRENYVLEMMKYIKIDIYGKCDSYFPNVKQIPCSKDSLNDCFADLVDSYKYYLSFENSLCDDYITEKYWKFYTDEMIFKTNILPIVRGAKRYQYESVANMKSFIFSDDFESPKALAYYLNHLNLNPSLYLEYFKWKIDLYNDLNNAKLEDIVYDNNLIQSNVNAPLCYLCSMLHNETYLNSNSNRIWKISEWFSVEKSCWDHDENRKIFFWFAQLAGYCF